VGVEELAPGVLNGQIEQIDLVGRDVIPVSRGLEATRWTEVAEHART
jgi:hypothetical protein